MDLTKYKKILDEAGIDTARIDVLAIFEHVLGVGKAKILAGGFELSLIEQKQIEDLISKRAKRMPLAYLLGSKEFYGRKFYVYKNVLIPRPESEAMIELMLGIISKIQDPRSIVDIGTGSGCLIITANLELSKIQSAGQRTKIQFLGIDISKEALSVAKQNAIKLGAKIDFQQSDLLDAIHLDPRSKIQNLVILANLPYVPQNLITSVEITNEPKIALFSGQDGLDHYRKFWQQVANLEPRPKFVIAECLEQQFEELDALATNAGFKLFSTSGPARCYS